MPEIRFIVGPDAGRGIRLDTYYSALPDSLSRSRLKNGIISVMVNNRPAKLSRTVRPHDSVIILWEDPVPENVIPENIPLEIIFEDDNVTVINKKQGMVTHPAAGNWTGTLVHALLWHWQENDGSACYRQGIVHRLDKDTSGVIITARNPESLAWLQEQFASHRVKKYMLLFYPVCLRKNPDI
ncbi:pseudouridine synthase [Brucepastera parasyntrophica]|uniref:pseudouridine synthase n=1 Tax=Brucepastera parasyntrophica TaxID=2880008 RepID=UPI00210A14F3|nr:RluA family pseudouridine synthase [Brucepastera parasyntrophica]